VVATPFTGVGNQKPVTTRLLPLPTMLPPQPAPAVAPRLITPEAVAQWARRELLYVTLYDLLIDALAAEHGARLMSTQSAESWLNARYDTLKRRLASARREASTQEVIEIAAGARRLRPQREGESGDVEAL